MTTNTSISYQVTELLKAMGDEPFAARQLIERLGVKYESMGAVSGCLSHMQKIGALKSEISHEWRGYKWWIADRDTLNSYAARMTPSAGNPNGARPSKVKALVIPEQPTKPLHERLWELAIELSEGTVDLSKVPVEQLAAELNRRLAK